MRRRWSGSGSRRWRADPELGPQDAETTYFCNTCGQPLCARCRDETHRARMFARHDIVALGQRSRDVLQKCSECDAPGGDSRADGEGTGAGTAPALAAAPHQSPPRSAARRALHHVLHRQEVAAVHPLLPGHAGVGRGGGRRGDGERALAPAHQRSPQGEPSPLRGPRVGLRAGLRAPGAGGAGERGALRRRDRVGDARPRARRSCPVPRP